MRQFENTKEPITAGEYQELIAELELTGFDDNPIGEALLDAIKRIAQRIEERERIDGNSDIH